MSYADDLIHQADHLLKLDQRKPKQASLRRAVSAAYYSLFHFLSEKASISVVGSAHGKQDLRRVTARALTHTQMKSACNEFLKPTPCAVLQPFFSGLSISGIPEMKDLAQAFIDVQGERHDADYNLSRTFTRYEAQVTIDQVKKAKRDWDTMEQKHPEAAQLFALTLFFMESWRKR